MFVTRDKETKRFHFAFKWTLQNLPRIVAVLAYVKYITPGIHVLSTSKNTCLLASPGNGNGVFLDARSEQTRVLEGNYLYYDTLSSQWIRSGKILVPEIHSMRRTLKILCIVASVFTSFILTRR